MKNIFVGNLSFSTTEDSIRQAFEQYGAIDRVSLVTDRDTGRSRGFAFVEMADDQAADKAIAAINGTEIDGRTVNVNVARPRENRSGGFGNSGRGKFGGGRSGGFREGNRRTEPRW